MAELEEENTYFRQALNLPPPNRAPLGRGPTGKDQPYQDMERTRRSTVSPSGRSSAGSPASYTSSQGSPSLIASSLSSRTMTMSEAGSSWTDSMILSERPTHLMQSSSTQIAGPSVPPNQPPRILAPMPFKANYHDRTIPPLHSSSNPFYPPGTPTNCSPTSDHSMESSMEGTRESIMPRDIRDDIPRHLYPFPQNYSVNDPNLHSEGPLQMSSSVPVHYQYHDCCTTQREWDASHSDRMHGLRDQGLPANRRFVHPSDPTQPQHNLQPSDYSR